MPFFEDLISPFTMANEEEAMREAIRAQRQAEARQAAELTGGMEDYSAAIQNAIGTYDPMVEAFGGAPAAYADVLGLGGSEGAQRARDMFVESPGYQYELDQGLEALERSRARRGMLASGNLTADEFAYSQGLANKDWMNWADMLRDAGSEYGGVLDDISGLYGDLGTQQYTHGVNMGNLYGGTERAIGQEKSRYSLGKEGLLPNYIGAITGTVQAAMGMPPTAWGSIGDGEAYPSQTPAPGQSQGSQALGFGPRASGPTNLRPQGYDQFDEFRAGGAY